MDFDPKAQVFGNTPETEKHTISHTTPTSQTDHNMLNDTPRNDGNTADQHIMNSDALFRMLAENSTDIIWIMDIETLKLTYVSLSAQKICGFTPDEVIGIPLERILTPESYSRTLLKMQEELKLDEFRQIEPDHISLLEFEHYCKDGSTISCEARMRFIRDTIGVPVRVYGIMRDVSERKQMENALLVEHDMFSTVFENAPYIMLLVNQDITVANINRKGVEFCGRNKDVLYNLLCGQVLNCVNALGAQGCGMNTQCLSCQIRKRVEQTFKTGEAAYEQDGRLSVFANGEEIYFDLLISTALVKTRDGVCVLVTIVDITERKHVEEALRESEKRFSALFDSSPIPIIELDCSEMDNYFSSLRSSGIRDFRIYFNANPEAIAACTSLISVSNANHASIEFFGAESIDSVISGMPEYFAAQPLLTYKEELIALAEGAVRFENKAPVNIYTRGDLTVFHVISVVPGCEQNLERVLVSFIDVTKQTEMYDREHNIANILQRALLPSRTPKISGCEISVEYLPALKEAQVGGDFYDVFQLPDGKVGILIGDVVGKGLSAADRVAAARYTIRSYAYLDSDPSRVLTLANNALCRERGNDIYDSLMLAAFFAVLDVNGCNLEYASGGNEPPILIGADGTLQELRVEGHMMGIWRDHEYSKERRTIHPGDKIVMMTDGIIEAKSDTLQQFGHEGVYCYLASNYSQTPKDLTSGILQTTIKHAGGALQDDAVIIAIAVNCV